MKLKRGKCKCKEPLTILSFEGPLVCLNCCKRINPKQDGWDFSTNKPIVERDLPSIKPYAKKPKIWEIILKKFCKRGSK